MASPASTQPMTREELNKTAHAILSKARLVGASRGRQDGSRDSETAVELQRDCQAIKAAIEQLRRQCAELPTPPTPEGTAMNLVLEEMRLKAELAVLHRERAGVISTNDVVKQIEAYQQFRDSNTELGQLLTVLKEERKKVQNELKSEQTWLRETQELEVALEKELATAQTKTGQKRTSNAEAELREKITQAEETIRSLQENLIQFTTDEIIQPTEEVERRGAGRKRGRGQARLDTMLLRGEGEYDGTNQFPSLADVVQDLIAQTLSSPHSPYLPLSSIWPPHGNLLMRSGVIQRHPDNPGLVRVTPFHL